MLCAKPEALVLLGALLIVRLDPAGKYQAPLASGCHPVTPGIGEERSAGKRLPEAGRCGQIAAQLSRMGNIPGCLHATQVSPVGSHWGHSESRRSTGEALGVP